MSVTDADTVEKVKASVHLGLFGLAVTAGLYNLACLCERPASHLKVNAVVYVCLSLFEATQVLRHR